MRTLPGFAISTKPKHFHGGPIARRRSALGAPGSKDWGVASQRLGKSFRTLAAAEGDTDSYTSQHRTKEEEKESQR